MDQNVGILLYTMSLSGGLSRLCTPLFLIQAGGDQDET
jgi:hypothetical protein